MASSIVQIANLALIEVGAEPILSLDEASSQARAVNAVWDAVRQTVLRAYPWSCAKKQQILAPSGTNVPKHTWTYGFVLPPDCLRLLTIEGEHPYSLQGRVIYTDIDALEITYIFDQVDPTKYDALLASALAARLAWSISYKLTQSASLKDSLWETYKKVLQEARSINAQETALASVEAEQWLDSRDSAPYNNRSGL